MKTPKAYTNLLKEGKITKEILGEVIYSYNKRAKNYRDQKRKYGASIYDKYDNYEKNEAKEKEMYRKKEYILRHLKPVCIHKEEKDNRHYIRVYDEEGYGETEYKGYDYKDICKKREKFEIKKFGHFIDWNDNYGLKVEFVDIWEHETIYLYFLYYEVGEFTFHTPINEDEIKKYELDTRDINDFITEGKDINDLLSVQFCDKVFNQIDNLIICD